MVGMLRPRESQAGAEREARRLRPSYLIRVIPAKGARMAMTADVVIAGGGVIGTAIAWRAAAAGLDVVVVDPECGDAASLVAAGMLAPVSESLFGEGALLRLNLLALRRLPAVPGAAGGGDGPPARLP